MCHLPGYDQSGNAAILLFFMVHSAHIHHQGWLASAEGPTIHHGESMAQLMNVAIRRPWQAGFEADVLISMCVPVVSNSGISANVTSLELTGLADFGKHLQSQSNP
jgi:hypothetical protein